MRRWFWGGLNFNNGCHTKSPPLPAKLKNTPSDIHISLPPPEPPPHPWPPPPNTENAQQLRGFHSGTAFAKTRPWRGWSLTTNATQKRRPSQKYSTINPLTHKLLSPHQYHHLLRGHLNPTTRIPNNFVAFTLVPPTPKGDRGVWTPTTNATQEKRPSQTCSTINPLTHTLR